MRAGLAAAALATGILLTTTPVAANAAASSSTTMDTATVAPNVVHTCTINRIVEYKRWCYSGHVPAADAHWINLTVEQYALETYWWVVDVSNGHVIRSGSGPTRQTIGAVYGTYQLKMYGDGAKGWLKNECCP